MAYLEVTGMVLAVNPELNTVLLKLSGLLDENDSAWVLRPPTMPEWCNSYLFHADLDASFETFDQLKEKPEMLRNFRASRSAHLSHGQNKARLKDFVDRHNFPVAKRSTEVLTHYQCPECDQWWTIGDSPYKPGDAIYCPNGHQSIISAHDSRNDKLEPIS